MCSLAAFGFIISYLHKDSLTASSWHARVKIAPNLFNRALFKEIKMLIIIYQNGEHLWRIEIGHIY